MFTCTVGVDVVHVYNVYIDVCVIICMCVSALILMILVCQVLLPAPSVRDISDESSLKQKDDQIRSLSSESK